MINVIASITVKEGRLHDFLQVFTANVPLVRGEDGCIEYIPALDLETDIPVQTVDKNVVTIIEKWQSPEALKAHLTSPRMLAYKEKAGEMIEKVTIKVLQEV